MADALRGVPFRILCALLFVASATTAIPTVAHALNVCTTCAVVAADDNYTATYDPTGTTVRGTATTGVLANDSGPSTTVVDLQDTPDTPGGHTVTTLYGYTVTINNDGSFTYRADADFSGIDSFDYYIWDSKNHDNFDFASVYITIVPIVANDSYATTVGKSLSVAAPGVTANDKGVDVDSIAFDTTSARGGTIVDGLGGGFTYTPPPFFAGVDTFTYEAWDLDFDISYIGVVSISVIGVGKTVPDPPTGVGATAGNASASVAFTPPVNNGGATITGYQSTCTSSNGGVLGTGSATASPISVTGLTNGATYTCTVRASNIVGTSNASTPSNAFVPATVPDAPTNVVATPANASASIAFAAPANNGGASITGYDVACASSDGGAAGGASGTASPIVVSALSNGKTYTCTVTATNAKGTSAPSGASNAFVPVRVPDPPVNVSATADDASATVTFTPGSDGGSAVTRFDVSCASSNGGTPGAASGASNPITVTGLTNGKAYTCSVTATNARGTSEASAPSNPVVPVTVPSAPSAVTVTPGNAAATVAYDVPSDDGGTPVTRYDATCTSSNGGVTGSLSGSAGPIVVTGLTNGKTYTCTVTATNAKGTSAPSAPSNTAVPFGCTGACISIGDQALVEGDSGAYSITFPVTLSDPATVPVTVKYAVVAGSATTGSKAAAGVDVKTKSGTLTFKVKTSGFTATKIDVAVTGFGDSVAEGDETFTVVLSSPTGGYQIGRGVGRGTIIDDDSDAPGATLGVGDSAIVNARSGTQAVAVPVTLSAPLSNTVTVAYTITPGTATYSAKASGGGDFGGKLSGTLTFPSGARFKKISLPLWASPGLANDKKFTVTLTTVTGSGVSVSRSVGSETIVGGY